MKKRVIMPPSNPQRRVELMQVLDMILDVLAYIWYGIKRIFKNPVSRDAAIVLISVLVSVLVINARTKSINEQAEQRIAAIEQRYQSELAAAQSQTADSAATSTQQSKYSADAEYIAKVVAGCATYYSENVQRAVAWCVLNRVDSALYPDTIKEVCEQANQWQGYENAPLIDSICRVCQDVIDTWQSGGTRDIPRECVFLRMTEDGVELRTEFTGGNTWNVVNN